MRQQTLFLIMFLVVAGCGTREQTNHDMTQKQITYLALGDSYTIGEGVAPGERWPVQLAASLTGAGLACAPPRIIAQTGWTTDELMAAIEDADVASPFELVSLLIGVNNQYRGRSVENFRIEFNTLLDVAIGFAGDDPDRVFVVSIPDWGVTPFAEGRDREKIAEEIDAYNLVKKEETEKRGIPFIDVTGISREAGSDSSLLAGDGLHPSGSMYRMWTEKITPVVLEKIKR